MPGLIGQFFAIIRFRAGPQDLPGGWGLALACIAAYVMLGLVSDRLVAPGENSPRGLFSVAFQLLMISILLRLRGLAIRLPQTISALTGTGSLFGLALVAVLLQIPADGEMVNPLVQWLGLLLFFWSLAVDGHIYRHALSTTMSSGMIVAVMMFALNFVLINALFPVTPQP